MNLRLVTTFALCGVLTAGALQAQLVTPTSITLDASTQFFSADNLIDNSGLSGPADASNYTTVTHANASGSTAWVTEDPGGPSSDYFAVDPMLAPLPVMTVGLGGIYEVTDVVSWGYHFGSTNGNEAQGMTLEFSTDGGSSYPSSVDVIRTFSAESADTQSFGGSYMADTVRVTMTDNFFGDADGGDRVGLGELKFLAVPEPSTGLLACVLLVLGAAVKRRQR